MNFLLDVGALLMLMTWRRLFRRELETKARSSVELVVLWDCQWRLKFFRDKSEMLVMGNTLQRDPSVHLLGGPIRRVFASRYLGVLTTC